jgi:hypothetical protein
VGYAGRSIRIEQENEMEKVVSLSDVISSWDFAIKARFVCFRNSLVVVDDNFIIDVTVSESFILNQRG